MLQMLLVGHHNFWNIVTCARYIGPGTCPMEPKLIFPIFWNGQIHVHFALARLWGLWWLIIIITDMMKIYMQWHSLKTGLWPGLADFQTNISTWIVSTRGGRYIRRKSVGARIACDRVWKIFSAMKNVLGKWSPVWPRISPRDCPVPMRLINS